MITLLICALTLAAVLQPNVPRFIAAGAFVGVAVIHEWLFSHLPGAGYYLSAGLFDLFVVLLVSLIDPVPRMALRLQALCIASIFANMAGWLLWLNYLPLTAYDWSFVGLYSWALFVLLKRDTEDVGCGAVGGWVLGLRRARCARVLHTREHSG